MADADRQDIASKYPKCYFCLENGKFTETLLNKFCVNRQRQQMITVNMWSIPGHWINSDTIPVFVLNIPLKLYVGYC